MAKFHPGLKQPYKGLDRHRHLSRLSADIFIGDKNLIKAVSPCFGLLQQMTQLFYASVANELREENITHYTVENESRLIEIIRRRTVTFANREATSRDVGRRIERTYQKAERAFKQFYDNQNQNQTREGGEES